MSPRLTRRIHRTRAPGSDPGDESDIVELESVELTGVFSAPQWLRDLGFASWLLAGVGAVLIGATWVAALTSTIVVPVVVAGVVAAVTSPLVSKLQRRGLPRAAGAALVFVGLLVLGAVFVLMIVGGISSQASDLSPKLAQGADKIQGWLQDLGVSSDSAQHANSDAGAGGVNLTLSASAGTTNLNVTQHLKGLNTSATAKVVLTPVAGPAPPPYTAGNKYLQTASNGGSTLSIAGNSSVDIGNGAMIIDYTGGGGAAALAAVDTYITSAFDSGLWNLPGLTSGVAAADGTFATGVGFLNNDQIGYNGITGVMALLGRLRTGTRRDSQVVQPGKGVWLRGIVRRVRRRLPA
jgi:hypothetical protein